MKSYRKIIVGLVTIFTLLTLLVSPTLAYADGETEPPPPTEAATEPPPALEESATEVPSAESIEPESPVIPLVDDPNASTDAATEPPPPTVESVATESPVSPEVDIVPVDDPNASTELTAPGETSLLEVIQELPTPTGVVVLDESGDVLPLATQEAAAIIVEGDPVWCKTGSKPGDATCSISYANLNTLITNIGSLINSSGTIWITSGTITEGGPVNLDGAIYPDWAPHTLTLQGGWNGAFDSNGTITTTNSVFSVPLTITSWGNDITVNNITINGASGDGLTVTSSQDVAIANSTFENSAGSGVYMYDVGTVTIDDSLVRGNGGWGLTLGHSESVILANSAFTGNGEEIEDGAYIQSTTNAVITNSVFKQNGGNGAFIDSAKATITGSTFDRNNDNGVELYNVDSASISNNTFNGNDGAGLAIDSPSYTLATVEGNTFKQNGTGIDLFAELSSSLMPDGKIDATLKCNTFQQNGTDIKTSGNVDITETNRSCGSDDNSGKHDSGNGNIIFIPPDQNFVAFNMDCSLYDSYLVKWVTGDQVLLSCVKDAMVRVSRVDNTALPKDLSAGFEYASAFAIEIFQNGVPLTILPDGGFIQFGFASRHENPQYGIMYWDEENGDWIQLKDFQIDTVGAPVSFSLHPSNQQDGYRVLSGARLLVNGNRYREEVTTNFTGTFVLVQH